MTGAPTWYDVLGVARDATPEQVRTAWRDQIADLEPGDRRFDALNRAAKVLLDADARAAYDSEHPEAAEHEETTEPAEADGADGAAEALEPSTSALTEVETARERRRLARAAGREAAAETRARSRRQAAERRSAGEPDAREPEAASRRAGVPTWLLAGLGIVAAGLVAATAWTWNGTAAAGGEDSPARQAQVAAEKAVVPVLSYDYQHLDEDQQAAQALMTGGYRTEYDKLFAVLEDNAPRTETTVSASVVASGIVRATDDRVQVLVFVDRPTTNKLNPEPVVYKDQVTLSMQRVDGEWLVDDLITSPVQG